MCVSANPQVVFEHPSLCVQTLKKPCKTKLNRPILELMGQCQYWYYGVKNDQYPYICWYSRYRYTGGYSIYIYIVVSWVWRNLQLTLQQCSSPAQGNTALESRANGPNSQLGEEPVTQPQNMMCNCGEFQPPQQRTNTISKVLISAITTHPHWCIWGEIGRAMYWSGGTHSTLAECWPGLFQYQAFFLAPPTH